MSSDFHRWDESRHIVPSSSSQYFGMSERNCRLFQKRRLESELRVMRCKQESSSRVHLDREVRVKRMNLFIESSIRVANGKIVMFHLPCHSISFILLDVRKVPKRSTACSKKVSIFESAVEVVDKQCDYSPLFVIKGGIKSVDALTRANPSALPIILYSKGRMTYLPSFNEILGSQTILLTWTSPLIAIALEQGARIVYPALWRRQESCCALTQ